MLSPSSPAGALARQLVVSTRGSSGEGWGSAGTEASGAAKSNAEVRSPTALRLHAVRFGTSAPKRVSMKRSSEVWSKTSELTRPPRLKGEITSSGTRKPSPMGPATPAASEGSGLTLRNSPAVPGGGTGGGTWSKKPPFSS